jgi:RNA polymerase sigma factor (sigma-70 family)
MAPVAHNTSEEISTLRRSAYRAIRAELRKAGLGRSNDIEDIFQDAYLIVVKVSRAGRKINNVKLFLLTVCRYSARHYMRKFIRRERIQVLFPTDLVRAVHGESQLSAAHRLEERDLILKALRRLSGCPRRIVDMMYVENLSDAEMREILGLEEGAFRAAKHRALKKFQLEILKIVEGRG